MGGRKAIGYGVAAVVLAVIVLLLLKSCPKPTDDAPFDYFRAKATELGSDPARVAKFVADEVKTLSYNGDVKGALATLWEGAGSPEEKSALLDALLAHCGKPAGAAKGPIFTATILHRGAVETVVYEGPIGDLVGDVHSIETFAPGKTRITVRARKPVVKELDAGADREEIVFRVQRPVEPVEVVRELWHKDNRIGPVSAVAGDRHDFVVLPCRIGKYVREKEEHLLQVRGRDKSEEAKGYLALLDYCLRSDLALADLERDLKLRARFDVPRILVLSRMKVPDLPDGVLALDLRLNRVAFDGGDKADAYLAAQVRSFVESGLEQHFLTDLTKLPCTSTYDVFNKVNDDYPNSYDRRLGLIGASLAALGDGGRAVFRARKDGSTVTVTKEGERFVQSGARISESVARAVGPDPDPALAVELALMSTGAPPDYVLDVVELSRGDDSLVTAGAKFVFRWGEGEDRTDQAIVVDGCSGDLDLRWRVQSGVRPARGRRVVTRQALLESTTHNPWYLTGEDRQEDATSFCVSRKVFQQLREAKGVAMSFLGRYGPDDERDAPRPVAWKGQVTRTGEGVHRALINGREEEIRFIKAKMGDADVAILDDARFPVGMADKIVEIRTSIRARLVDESGLGIPGAVVTVAGGGGGTTGPDGRFILPPASGKVKLTAVRGGHTLGEREIDLTAPGRSDVLVTVPRLRTELLFITKSNSKQLDALDLTPQARRHLDRFVAAGYQVVIPNRKIEVDGVDVIAYYAHDIASGDIIGVTEDGLHGSSAAWSRALASLARDLAKAKGKLTPFAHVHAMRGAIVAWWIYSKDRVGGYTHEEAIKKMLEEMDYWEKSTNLLTGLGEVPGARQAMRSAMKSAGLGGLGGAGSAAAFKIGYLGSTAFLERKLEGS